MLGRKSDLLILSLKGKFYKITQELFQIFKMTSIMPKIGIYLVKILIFTYYVNENLSLSLNGKYDEKYYLLLKLST